jgi:hypothetical protein
VIDDHPDPGSYPPVDLATGESSLESLAAREHAILQPCDFRDRSIRYPMRAMTVS